VLEGSTRLLQRLLPETVRLELERGPGDGPRPVLADRGQVEQVVMNLALNAAEAMPKGGVIRVRAGMSADEAWLAVSDTGHGIPEAIRDRVFEPFFTTKASQGGSGLGLAVVHGIVVRHGGRIELDTGPGRGTTMTVFFPRAGSGPHAEVPPVVTDLDDVPLGAGETILLLEDEDATRAGLEELLATLGYRVVGVATTAAALVAAEQVRPALLLSDMVLPDGSGAELARRLQRTRPDLPVVFMSGYSQDEVVRRGAGDGSVSYLQKPFDMKTLAREVRSALARAGT